MKDRQTVKQITNTMTVMRLVVVTRVIAI